VGDGYDDQGDAEPVASSTSDVTNATRIDQRAAFRSAVSVLLEFA
jgi:hypothetical protein